MSDTRHFIVEIGDGVPRLADTTHVARVAGTLVVSDRPLLGVGDELARLGDAPPDEVVLCGADRTPRRASKRELHRDGSRIVLWVVGEPGPWRSVDAAKLLAAAAAHTTPPRIVGTSAASHGGADGRRARQLAASAVAVLVVGAACLAIGHRLGRGPAAGTTPGTVSDAGVATGQLSDGGGAIRAPAPSPPARLPVEVIEWRPDLALAPDPTCNRWGDITSVEPTRVRHVLCGGALDGGARTRAICVAARCVGIDARAEPQLPLRVCARDGTQTELVKHTRAHRPGYRASPRTAPCPRASYVAGSP